MKILLIGANGQLGYDLQQVITHEAPAHMVVPLIHRDIEVTDTTHLQGLLKTYQPDIVINTAAYHRIDEVEQFPELAFTVNTIASWHLAQLCNQMNCALVFISTDYVFGGDRSRRTPYSEQDAPAPQNVYGASKLAGEYLIRSACDRYYIIRTSGLYGVRGPSGKSSNFVDLMIRKSKDGNRIHVVDDQRLTPTYTKDLAIAILRLIKSNRYGLYHITNAGDCTWYQFAAKIFELAGLKVDLSPTTSSEFKTVATRPAYSVLAKDALAKIGLPAMRPWEAALQDYLNLRWGK